MFRGVDFRPRPGCVWVDGFLPRVSNIAQGYNRQRLFGIYFSYLGAYISVSSRRCTVALQVGNHFIILRCLRSYYVHVLL